MKKKRSFNSTLILRISLFFLTLSCFFGATSYAWFSANNVLQMNNADMGLTFDDTTAEYEVYKYNTQEDTGELFSAGIGAIDFNAYDLIFTARNRYTPIFARIEIKRVNSMPKTGTLSIRINRQGHDDTSASKLSQYCSSIMRFTATIDNEYLSFVGDPDELYRHVDGILYNTTKDYKAFEPTVAIPANSGAFTSVSVSGDTKTYTKTDSITLTLDYADGDWAIEDGIDVLNVCLYITYDEGLVKCYKNETGGSTGSFTTFDKIEFENDLTTVVIDYTTN